MYWHGNIRVEALSNNDFRREVVTGDMSQITLMSVGPDESIGPETHHDTDQIHVFLEGEGEATLEEESFMVGPGDVVFVQAGTEHAFRNTGDTPLKLWTVYAPPHHPKGTVHATQADESGDSDDDGVIENVKEDIEETARST